jgi:hypothetical protein
LEIILPELGTSMTSATQRNRRITILLTERLVLLDINIPNNTKKDMYNTDRKMMLKIFAHSRPPRAISLEKVTMTRLTIMPKSRGTTTINIRARYLPSNILCRGIGPANMSLSVPLSLSPQKLLYAKIKVAKLRKREIMKTQSTSLKPKSRAFALPLI